MSLSPGFAEFDGNYAKGKPQVVIRRIVSDLETPVSAYLKLAGRRRNAFLLESVDGGEKLGRYSVIGMRPDAIWRARGSQAEINRRAAAGCLISRPTIALLSKACAPSLTNRQSTCPLPRRLWRRAFSDFSDMIWRGRSSGCPIGRKRRLIWSTPSSSDRR